MSEQNQIERDQKTAFAEAWLKYPTEPQKAAFAICDDPGKALQIAFHWSKDEFVLSEKIRILETKGLKPYLANRDQQAKDIYEIAQHDKVDFETRLKAHRLYAEVMNHIDKQPANTTQILSTGVMIVKDHGSDDNWEKNVIDQQARLISHAAN